jgi:anti-sigma factor RsiW
MNCNFVESRLAAYIDGELDGVDMLRVRSHVSDCRQCAFELDSLREVKSMLGNLPTRKPANDFESRLLNAIQSEESRTVRVARGFTFRLGWSGMAVAAAAAVCAVVVFSFNQHDENNVATAPPAVAPREGFERDQIYFQASSPLSQGVTVSYEGISSNR